MFSRCLGVVVATTLTIAFAVRAADPEGEGRPPMPEPLFTETVTDLDGYEPGEFELELNGTHLRSWRGGAYALQGGLEAEWLVTRKLGVRAEPTFARSIQTAGAEAESTFGGSVAASWKLVQNFEDDFHLQAEVAGRLPWDTAITVWAGDSALPLSFDLRSGIRRGVLTVRGGVGAVAGGSSAHLPLRGSLALLTGFGSGERLSFWGIELDADGSRRTPAVVALNLVPHLGPLGLPFRLGFAIPWAIGVPENQPSIGLFVRLFVESAREITYAKTHHPE
jgi:hypothetical protein